MLPLILGLATLAAAASRPNFIFIMADDQDMHLGSLDYQPAVLKHFRDAGSWFVKHFCTVSICCPSRVSLLTGRAAHNTNVTDVELPYGGYHKFVAEGLNDKYLPIWLQEAGYATYYTGKLLNGVSATAPEKPRGWTRSAFLVEPGLYNYFNACMAIDHGPLQLYTGLYSTDVIANHTIDFLHDAMEADKPFFLGVAPTAPHGERVVDKTPIMFEAPVPAQRHEHLFPDAKVARTPDFNQAADGSVSYFAVIPPLTDAQITYSDTFYQRRLQALQALDELVDSVVTKLYTRPDLASNTYLIYTSDNGYHIGQHRLPPGKTSNIDSDLNVPFFVRGPGIPSAKIITTPTSHTDIVPSIFKFAGIPLRDEFDGEPMPWTGEGNRQEHVNVEFWGKRFTEGTVFDMEDDEALRNTYKTLRIVGSDYDFSYTVWCTNEHELYDIKLDPWQMNNIYTNITATSGFSIPLLITRLDTLLLTLKGCTRNVCRRPWEALFPGGGVASLRDAMDPKYDAFFDQGQSRVGFSECLDGYETRAEGALFPVAFGVNCSV
ncbi:hypothetical protein CDD81_725 [Ophiocordyceps australis]|uniref:Sulfatase N-terminal domain-containing protein n=1 Tax=Ophiocordyceps australis TaxID=1399860 RepID=A0A2C5XXH0_9HYPO|nr:hypothetical protein CDD81_725 [Ophiocordyceps australis]